ncbi:hypothetical protein JHK87_030851 [Glycine soja]|nr:hypothetical protein JHK87_030851 [Glycine soja]
MPLSYFTISRHSDSKQQPDSRRLAPPSPAGRGRNRGRGHGESSSILAPSPVNAPSTPPPASTIGVPSGAAPVCAASSSPTTESESLTSAVEKAILKDIKGSKISCTHLQYGVADVVNNVGGLENHTLKDCFIMNCDGALCQATQIASCGAVLRKDNGNFVQAFSRRLGHCSVLEAELWSIFYGMQMALDAGVTKLNVKSDSLAAVRLLDEFWSTPTQYPDLIHEIWSLKDKFVFCMCSHIQRKKKTLADSFAKFGLSVSIGCMFFNCVPAFVVTLLMEEFSIVDS